MTAILAANFLSSIRIAIASLLLLGDTDGPAPPAGGLGVLAPDPDAPVVTQAPVSPDLLQALKVLAELVVQHVGHHLGGLACNMD